MGAENRGGLAWSGLSFRGSLGLSPWCDGSSIIYLFIFWELLASTELECLSTELVLLTSRPPLFPCTQSAMALPPSMRLCLRPVAVEKDARPVGIGRNVGVGQEDAVLGHAGERHRRLAGLVRALRGLDALKHFRVQALRERVGDVGALEPAQQQGDAVDALSPVEAGRALGQGHEASLGDRVGDAGVEAVVARVAADVDDESARGLLLFELRDGGLGGVVGPVEVHGHDAVPLLLGNGAHGREGVHDAGVVDEDVEAAEFGDGHVDEVLDGVFAADVGVLGQELAGVRLDPFLLDSGDALVVDVADDNVGAGS